MTISFPAQRIEADARKNTLEPGAPAPRPGEAATVGVVVTTYNHAHFLADALESVHAQTRLPDAVVVVDDGSSDDPAGVVARFPAVRIIRQENRGLAAARNVGLGALNTSHAVFLDADDCLEEGAIEAGLACFARMPQCGFVYGGHRYVDSDGHQIGERFEPPGENPHVQLLRGNFIGMHGTVMYRRDRLVAVGAFDERLQRCEDYDLYLRMTRHYPIAGYPDVVAAYRRHGKNMSVDHGTMLRAALDVHARYAPADREGRAIWAQGRRRWRRCYAEEMAADRYSRRMAGGGLAASLPALASIVAAAPGVAVGQAIGGIRRRIAGFVPVSLRRRLFTGSRGAPPVGRVRLGDLHRVHPISERFGFDRGLPVDRYYIEAFLARHASEIVGRVLEVGDDDYTRRFGRGRVSRSDVLHVHEGNPRATIVGDLTDPQFLAAQGFDCIVLTQTLQLIYDVRKAIVHLHRALAPGGVVLATVPGVSQIDRGEWGKTWFWSFTPLALERLFGDVFGPEAVAVEAYGNVFAATMFLQGLAVQELDTADLDPRDRAYPVVVGVRARKRSG
jgi:GT2 family glycosyltransferase